MAGKARVHELAKELNVTSKDILQKLNDLGEFVKSASSTVEAPVARRLREHFGAVLGSHKAAKASSSSTVPRSSDRDPSSSSRVASSSAHSHNSNVFKANDRYQGKDSYDLLAKNNRKPIQPDRDGQRPSAKYYPVVDSKNPDQRNRTQVNNNIPRPAPQGLSPQGIPRPAAGSRQQPYSPKVANNPYSSNTQRHPGSRPSGGASSGRPPGPGGHPGSRPSGGASSGRPPGPGGHPGSRPSGGRPSFSPGSLPAAIPTGSPRSSGRGSRFGSGPGGAFGKQGGSSGGAYAKKSKKSKKQKKTEYDSIEAPELGGVRLPRGSGEIVRLARGASLSDFAEKINANPAALVQALFNLGEMVTATQSVSEEVLQLLGAEINFEVVIVSPEDEDRELLENFDVSFGDDGDEDQLKSRPPVVTVMGHVDHGKTRLLDTIRSSNVRGSEAGGITQHIGAYQVAVDFDGGKRLVTFIDTPGHEAFTAMRARGAKATDIAVLVVAADDGVMPQTIEAINHAQAADVPIVVAVNKIDKEGANPDRVRTQLTEFNLIAEEYGGQTMFINISARDETNIDKLLEAILLTADASLELVANPTIPAQGVAIEAHLDRGRGPVATVIIQRGTLTIGDSIVAGDAYGRVRRMLDENGDDVLEALPSRPVQVIGFTSVPGAGDNFLVVEEDRIARQIADRRNARKRNALQAKTRKRISLEDLDEVLKNSSQFNLILKGDNAGTVEALEEALLAIEIDDEVQLRVIDRGVGGVTETNVNLAAASDAVIIAFNVRPEGKANELANREGVDIRYYTVIYQALEEVEKALKGMLKPVYEERDLGSAEIREIFKSSKFGTIAGCLITSGVIKRNAKARIIRDSSVIVEVATIASLRREKDDVIEVREGYECGLTLTYSDFKIGDTIESYELVEKLRV